MSGSRNPQTSLPRSQTTLPRFLLQCSLYFANYEGMSKRHKVSHFMNLLTGKALKWATAMLEQGGEHVSSHEQFPELYCRVFYQSVTWGERCGRTAFVYIPSCSRICSWVPYHYTTAAGSGWMEQCSLESSVLPRSEPGSPHRFGLPQQAAYTGLTGPSAAQPSPRHFSGTHVTRARQACRGGKGEMTTWACCFYCSSPDHIIGLCPLCSRCTVRPGPSSSESSSTRSNIESLIQSISHQSVTLQYNTQVCLLFWQC